MGDRYKPWAVEVFPQGGSSTIIGGVTAQSIDTGAEVNAEVTAGATAPRYGEISQLQSFGSFTAHDLTKILGAIGAKGRCLAGGAGPGFAIWTLKKDACGEIAAGSVHRKLIIPNGRIVPNSLNASQGSRASMTCNVVSLFDGTNDPVVILENQAAPSGLEDVVGFHMGAVTLAGVTLERNASVNIEFGNNVSPENDDGEVFAKSLDVTSTQPVVTVTTHEVSKFGGGVGQIPLRGRLALHADTSIVLRRRLLGTGSFATGASHLKFTAGGVVTCKGTTANANSPYSMEAMLTSLDDGTNDMLTVDPAFVLGV